MEKEVDPDSQLLLDRLSAIMEVLIPAASLT
jgi:hypothetical protein